LAQARALLLSLQSPLGSLGRMGCGASIPATNAPSESTGVTQPKEPWRWGLTVQQLFDLGAEIFGSPQETYKTAMEVIDFGMGMYQQTAKKFKCEPDGFGGWKFNDLEEMSDKAKMNLYDVVKTVTASKTKGSGVSYSVLVNSGDHKEAEVFVSHAWAEKFAYFVFVLCFELFPASMFQGDDSDPMSQEELEEGKATWRKVLGNGDSALLPSTVIWVCALCIDQNADIQGELGGSVEESPFAQVLWRAMTKRVLVVYNPAISLYSRIWCCYEIFLAIKKQTEDSTFTIQTIGIPARKVKNDFEDYFGGHDGDRFVKLRCSDIAEDFDKVAEAATPWVEEFCSKHPLDVTEAKASVEADRQMILGALGDTTPKVNEMVNTLRKKMFLRLMPLIMEG